MVVDEDLFEDGLVELTPDMVGCGLIEAVTVSNEGQSLLQAVLDGTKFGVESAQGGLSGGHLSGDAVLFAFEQVKGYGTGVVGLQQLLAFAVQLGQAGAVALDLLGLFDLGSLGEVEHGSAEGLSDGLCEYHGLPQLSDVAFHDVDGDVGLEAGGTALLPTQTVEVGVGLAVAVGGFGDAHALATGPTEQAALEVVRVLVGLLFGQAAGVLQGLHLTEQFFGDEGLVSAGVLDALEDDNACVVGVGEHAFDHRHRHWGAVGAFGSWSGA